MFILAKAQNFFSCPYFKANNIPDYKTERIFKIDMQTRKLQVFISQPIRFQEISQHPQPTRDETTNRNISTLYEPIRKLLSRHFPQCNYLRNGSERTGKIFNKNRFVIPLSAEININVPFVYEYSLGWRVLRSR